MAENNFTAKVTAELDTSQLEKDLDKLSKKKIKVKADTGKSESDIAKVGNAITRAEKGAYSFGDAIKKSFQFGAAANIASKTFRLVDEACENTIETVTELDGAIKDLRIATGESYEYIEHLLKDYNTLAKNLKVTTQDVAESADTWLRQGYSIQESNELITQSTILSKVAQLEAAESAKYLTSAVKGYNIEVKEAASIIDKLTSVDVVSAVDAGGLAEGMSKTASNANLVNIEMDKLIGYLAVVGETTQKSMSLVGNSFQTIFSRMANIKSGVLEYIDEDGTKETLSDVETILNNLDIKLRDSDNEFRDFGVVLDEVASRWDSFSSVQQAAIAKAFAGTRQYENFVVLMENYDKAIQYTEVAMNSAGSASKKYSAYLDSIEAKTNSLQASFESLAFDTISPETIGNVIEATTAIVEFMDESQMLKGVLAGLATAGAIQAFLMLKKGISGASVQLNQFNSALTMLKAGGIGEAEIQQLAQMTSNLSKSQLQAVLSSKALTTEQRIAILTAQGMSEAEAKAALSSMGLATAEGTAAGATATLSGALKGLWASLMANPLILVATAVAAVTAGISKLISLSEEQAQAAKEQAQASKERADALTQEAEDIDSLIKEYKKLSESEEWGVEERTEAMEIQNEITRLVGTQADNLDLVNGKLDDELNKLLQIKNAISTEATSTYEKAYQDAKKNTEKYDTHKGNWLMDIAAWDNELTFDFWGDDENRNKGIKIIDEVWRQKGYGSANIEYVDGLIFTYDTYSKLIFDESLNVAQRIEALDAAIEALEQAEGYDYSNTELWKKLVEVRDELGGANGVFTQQMQAAYSLLENLTKSSIGSGKDVANVDEFNAYKKEILEKVISNDVLMQAMNEGALSTDTVNAYINSYFTTLDKYEEFFQSQTTQADRLASTFGSFNDTIKTVKAAIDELNSSGQVSAETYNQVIALNEDYADLFTFTNGKIEIAADEVDNLVESLIEEYGATLVANGATEEEIALMVSLAKTLKVVSEEFDDLKDKYKNNLDGLDHLSNTYENAIDELEAKGLKRTATYYEKLKAVEESKISILQDELAALTEEFQNAITSGKVEDGSEEWHKMNDEINKVKESIQKSQIAVLDFANEIRKIDWEYFDFQQQLNSKITNESDFLLDLFDDKNMVDEKGKLTEYGNASIGLHGLNYNVYLHQAKQYADEIANIEEELASDQYNQDLIDRKEELLELQRESVLAAEDEKQAMIDLVKQGIEAELEGLEKLIDKYKETLDGITDLYDYQNKVSDVTQEIGTLQKQIIAYENDTSEEAKAQIQQLKVDLEKANKELQETEYNKFIADQKKLLDRLYNDYEQVLNRRLDDVDTLISDCITSINDGATEIKETLEFVTGEVGASLSGEMANIWSITDEFKQVVQSSDSILNGTVSGIDGTLSGVATTTTTISSTLADIKTLVSNIKTNSTNHSTTSGSSNNAGGATNPPSTSATELPTKPSTPSTTTPAPAVKNPTVEETMAEKIVKFGNASGSGMNAGKSGDNGIITWNGSEYKVQNSGTVYDSSTPLYKAAVNVLKFSDRQIFGYNGKVYGYLDGKIQELEGRFWSSAGYDNFVKDMQAHYPAYKEGGIVDHTGLAWVDGTKTKPEAFLDAKDTQNISNLTSMLSKMAADDIYSSVVPVNMQFEPISYDNQYGKSLTNKVMSQVTNNSSKIEQNIKIENNIEIDHVQDYDDFVTRLQHDRQFEGMIVDMTIGRLNGGSSLAKYGYKWGEK